MLSIPNGPFNFVSKQSADPEFVSILVSYTPEEDTEWESYTLGRAPVQPTPGVDLTVAEQNAHVANLELAKNAGSHYLVQRWGDGTLCDKTGRPREVEVQFHCSMIMTDNILFVKETKTCSYVLVINTPRLCGEPGFKARHDTSDEAAIRCREVVDTLPSELLNLPVTDYPVKGPPSRKSNLPPSAPTAKADKIDDSVEKSIKQDQLVGDLLRQTVQALMQRKDNQFGETTEVFIELDEDDERNQEVSSKFIDALRAAGYDVRGAEFVGLKMEESSGSKKDRKKVKKPGDSKLAGDPARDEL